MNIEGAIFVAALVIGVISGLAYQHAVFMDHMRVINQNAGFSEIAKEYNDRADKAAVVWAVSACISLILLLAFFLAVVMS